MTNGENGSGYVALLHGGASSLSGAIARDLSLKGVNIVLHAEERCACAKEICRDVESTGRGFALLPVRPDESEEDVIQAALSVWGRLDILVNLFIPTAATTIGELALYPGRLLQRGFAAGKAMSGSPRAAIVNQCFLPSLFAGTSIESHIPLLKGAVTGVTRVLCRDMGKQGIRVNTVQTGLLDLPETRGFVTGEVLKQKPPTGRWGTPEDVAKFVSFLALRNGYMTGQATILDGGLTAGNTGT